ncbi:MAG: SDR family oxidoreductase [Actinobacteria bacterium]|nr:SDR family oxidoreductase [Actinomycetota bacterium]
MPRVVVITGASAGVGRATARRFAEAGDHVALLARGDEGLQGALEEVEAAGSRGMAIAVDVADFDAVERAANQVEETLGPIDVWVNNAMVTVFGPVTRLTAAEYRRVTEVTYLGAVHGTLAALRRMLPRDRGTIVQVDSAMAYRGIPLQSPYCAAKFAMRGFTDSLRTELIHDRSPIHVTMVHLPALNTPQFLWSRNRMGRRPQPVPPIFQPEVAAEAIEWASRQRRREVWVGRPTVLTIWGQRLLPGLLDLYLGRTGYESQLTEAPADAERGDNLMEPVPGDFGAHGPFDDRARDTSPQLWLTKRRGILAAVAGGLAAMFLLGGDDD